MGILGGTSTDVPKNFVEQHLIREETVICNYKLKRNLISLTNKRIIFINKTLLSRKIEIKSVPYKNIISISLVQSRKLFAFSDKITISTLNQNYEIKISKSEDIFDLYKTIVNRTCD